MKTKQLVLVALLAWGAAANAQEEKEKKSFGFDVTNISIGIGSGFSSAPDPQNFTNEDFTEHVASMVDIGLSANVYGKWNVRAGVGYMFGVLDPEEYFDEVLEYEQFAGIYDRVNGDVLSWYTNGVIPDSYVLPYVGFSRSFSVESVTITPYVTAWFSNERPRLYFDGYEVIATGEYVDNLVLGYEDWGVVPFTSLGLDVELDKYVLGLSYMLGSDPMPSLSLRLGYQL